MKRTIYKILAFFYPPILGRTLGLWIENIARAMVWPFEIFDELFKNKSSKSGFLQRTTKFMQPHIIDFDFDPLGAIWFAITWYLMLFNISLLIFFAVGILGHSLLVLFLSSSFRYILLLPYLYILRHSYALGFADLLRSKRRSVHGVRAVWSYIGIELAKMFFAIMSSSIIYLSFIRMAELYGR